MHCLLSHNCPVVIGRTAKKVRDRKKAAMEGPWPAGALLQKEKSKSFSCCGIQMSAGWMTGWLHCYGTDSQRHSCMHKHSFWVRSNFLREAQRRVCKNLTKTYNNKK